MNYFTLLSSYPDRMIAAWESQIKEEDYNPWLNDALKHSRDNLFARFAIHYAELLALPRGARRALQRRLARSGELGAILSAHQITRRLQFKMASSLAGAALLLALAQGTAAAA